MSSSRPITAGLAGLLTVGFVPLTGLSPASAVETAPVIAYTADVDGRGSSGVYMRNADGSGQPTTLVPEDATVPGADGQTHVDLTVSRDGSRIAYVAIAWTDGDGDVKGSLVVQDLRAGSVPKTIAEVALTYADHGAPQLDEPSFSPDGNTVVFSRQTYDQATGRFEAQLYRVPVTGGAATAIATSGESLLKATHTPAGNLLGLSYVADVDGYRVATVPAAGGSPTPVTGSPTSSGLYEFTFSADGGDVTWVQAEETTPDLLGGLYSRVYAAPWSESGPAASIGQASPLTARNTEQDYYSPTFTADGQDVVAVRYAQGGEGDGVTSDLVRIPAAGGTPTRIFTDTDVVWLDAAVGKQAFAGATADPVEQYVTQVYGDLFDREPDPQGLQNWTSALKSGTPYGQVANGITYSREFRSGLIAASYDDYLGRAPDPTGLENWLTAMSRGLHIEQMEAGFIASAEFYSQAGGQDRLWIASLYEAVLQRPADQTEVDFWQGQLDRTRDYNGVALGFLYSTEHLTDVVDGYYQHLLRRGIDPAGRDTWVTAIQRGSRDEEIIASIVSSAEYRNNVGRWVVPVRFLLADRTQEALIATYDQRLDCSSVDEDGSDFVVTVNGVTVADDAFDATCTTDSIQTGGGGEVFLRPTGAGFYDFGDVITLGRKAGSAVRSATGSTQPLDDSIEVGGGGNG